MIEDHRTGVPVNDAQSSLRVADIGPERPQPVADMLQGRSHRMGDACREHRVPHLSAVPTSQGRRDFGRGHYRADDASLDEAIDLANNTEYGLTAGIFSEDDKEIQRFFDRIEAGVTYVNRRAGATTGALLHVRAGRSAARA